MKITGRQQRSTRRGPLLKIQNRSAVPLTYEYGSYECSFVSQLPTCPLSLWEILELGLGDQIYCGSVGSTVPEYRSVVRISHKLTGNDFAARRTGDGESQTGGTPTPHFDHSVMHARTEHFGSPRDTGACDNTPAAEARGGPMPRVAMLTAMS